MATASAAEQFLLELINGERIKAGVQPLALDGDINDAAANHSLWMLSTGTFSHTGINGSSAKVRMESEGYDFTGSWAWGENIAWKTAGSASLQSNVSQLHTNLMNSSGHRANILSNNFREVGLGIERGSFRDRSDVVMLTEDFAKSGSDLFLTGVAFQDLDGDKFYDINEGLSGKVVSARNITTGATKTTTTEQAGGYKLALTNGTYEVNFNGKVSNITINGRNVKLDSVVAEDSTPPAPVTNIINGTTGNDRLIGTSGQDTIGGSSGNDTLNGRGGADILTGGTGRDAFVFTVNDGTMDRITDFNGDMIFIDGNAFTNLSYDNGIASSNGVPFVELVGAPSVEGAVYIF